MSIKELNQLIENPPSSFYFNYIFHEESSYKKKDHSNMLVVVIMITSKYINPIPSTSIKSKSTSENSLYLWNFNEATKEAMVNIGGSSELS